VIEWPALGRVGHAVDGMLEIGGEGLGSGRVALVIPVIGALRFVGRLGKRRTLRGATVRQAGAHLLPGDGGHRAGVQLMHAPLDFRPPSFVDVVLGACIQAIE
jgi:hypothetical protein